MAPIARACAEAGHEVAVAAPTSFAEHVRDAKLVHLPFPDAPPDLMGAVFGRLPTLPREAANRVVVAEIFGRLDAQAALPAVKEILAEWRPDIVVRDPCEFGSLVAAERHGIPQAQVAIAMGGFMGGVIGPWLDEPIAELASMAGLRSARGAELALSVPTLTSVPRSLDLAGEDQSAADEGSVWRFRTASRSADASLPAEWGEPSHPLVYVTLGSVTGSLGHFGDLYAALLDALAPLPVRVLMTTGNGYDPELLRPLPANAWATRWWPQEAVMSVARLVIGHGGFGTTMTTVAAGLPQLVLPLFASDQFHNAERIRSLAGAGRWLPDGAQSIPDVAGAVLDLLAERALRRERPRARRRDRSTPRRQQHGRHPAVPRPLTRTELRGPPTVPRHLLPLRGPPTALRGICCHSGCRGPHRTPRSSGHSCMPSSPR